ncbi:hypothetical protein [Vulcanisaeta sp. JCM 16161]|uniref:hypothetical protein n=1 Tax=Vulcanisaeta sp. JCM 16161 TaxID=1295372 RepID=UPI000ABD8A3D|nr:hypothetical protein [Vulcanisaeta sp. JCM 16161]
MKAIDVRQIMDKLLREVSKSVIGYELEVKLLFACLIAGGHALIEGYPGLAKTTLVKAFAKPLAYPLVAFNSPQTYCLVT